MDRRLGFAGGVTLALCSALLAPACGGSDYVDAFDAGPDALPDAHVNDATADTGSPDADAALDATADAKLDAVADAKLDADAALDAEAGSDSGTLGLMPNLGTASTFVVLSGPTLTNIGLNTVLEGDIGTTGPSITGLTGNPFQPTGSTEINNAKATQALLDVGTAYVSLTGKACPPANDLTGLDLGGMTLAPGVYCFSSSAGQIAGTTLTFDAQGDPNAVWIIQVKTALTVLDGAHAVMIGGPPSMACRIFWATGTAATLNTGVQYIGNFVSSSAISLLTNARLAPGRAFGQTGGVTLLSNTISAAACQ